MSTENKVRLLSLLAFLFLPAHGLDISGKVVDKRFLPIPGARVCVELSPSTCVTTAQDGTFRLQGTVSLHPRDQAMEGYRLETLRGVLALNAPRASSARLEWIDASGKKILTADNIALAAGSNAIAVPDGMEPGLVILRLTVAGSTSTWKAVWDAESLRGMNGNPGQGAAAGIAFAALAKAAVPGALLATKAGFANATYQPKVETETGNFIVLGGVGEKVSLMFDGKTFAGWYRSSGREFDNALDSWEIRNGVLHSMGTVTGALSTVKDYGNFRMIFKVQQFTQTASVKHYASILFWGRRPPPGGNLGGLQFGVPDGVFWDYRPGYDGAQAGRFFTMNQQGLNRYALSQCEIIAKMSTGVVKGACCTLTGNTPCKTKEYMVFKDPAAARLGPLGLHIHNPGLVDEYRDMTIEVDPISDDYVTTQ